MASGSVSRHPRGKWRARWREYPNGPQKARDFARKVDADKFLAQTLADISRGTYVDPNAGTVTFQEWGEMWRAGKVHRASTAAQVESHLRVHVYPVLGSRQLASVRPSEIQALVKRLGERLAPTTVETIYRHVAAIYGAAVRDRLVASSPCVGIDLPKPIRRRVVPLEVEQVRLIADTLGPRYRALVMLAAGTGMRQGECFGLTLDRVNFLDGRRIIVDRQLSSDPSGRELFGPVKTAASDRIIPLPETVAVELSEHLRKYEPGDHGLIFTAENGKPLQRNRFGDLWRRRMNATEGVPDWATFHDLRHFYASLLIRHGESVKVVQARLGHASAAETLDTYSHLWPDSEDQTRRAVDSVLGAEDSLRTTAAL